MSSPRRSSLWLWIAALLLLVPGMATAQTTGTIQGFVTSDNGDPIPGVTINVRNTETGAERIVITDAAGFYKASALVSGVYSVNASLEGMQTIQQDNVRLLLGQTIDGIVGLGGVVPTGWTVIEGPDGVRTGVYTGGQ